MIAFMLSYDMNILVTKVNPMVAFEISFIVALVVVRTPCNGH